MEEFKRKIQRDNVLTIIEIVACCLATIILNYVIADRFQIADFIRGFNTGVFIGIMCVLVFFLIRNLSALSSEEKLRKLYIQQTDERECFIYQKVGSVGIDISTGILMLATIIAGYINEIAFVAFLISLFIVIGSKLFTKIYYSMKY